MTAYTYSGSFPSSPQTNDTLVINDVEYTYTSKGSWAVTGGGILEGTSVRSTNEAGAVKFLREDGDGTSSWQSPPGGETLAQTLTIGNTVTAAGKIQFRDTGIYINSSVDGQLDIVADGEVQIAAPTIDINGAVALNGAITGVTNITATGTITGNGSGLTTLNGSNISSGTVAAARVATLNQNTTGSAATLTTARTIAGVSFNGSANISLNNNAITNGAGYTTSTGDITAVVAGTGISGGGTSGSVTITNSSPNVVQTTVTGSSGSCTGNSATVTNGVYTTGDQTIAGTKTFSGSITTPFLTSTAVPTRDKIRVWTDATYTIGMDNGISFGAINTNYAMTFQMSDSNNRGFWWGDSAHTDAQGAMSLSTDGKLTVATGARIGYGESDTTIPSAGLQVSGAVTATGGFTGNVTGSSGSCTGNAATATNATTAGGLAVGTGVNNSANQIVRTNGSGYTDFGWINTVSGAASGTPARIYCSQDAYIRYYTPAQFAPYILNQGSTKNSHVHSGSEITSGTVAAARVATLNQNTTGSSGSCTGTAANAATLDGIDSLSFLRSDATDYKTGVLYDRASIINETGYRNQSSMGTYVSTLTQQIWTMGTSYRSHASGTNFGNLYGLAYKHTNNGTGGAMASGHMMVWCQNGGATAAMGSNIWTSGNVTAYSDARVKTNIEVIDNALDKVCQLSGYTFDRTDQPDLARQTGVIAQEVIKVLPEAVLNGPTDKDPDGHYSVAYGNMVGLLIESTKEINGKVISLEAENTLLKSQLEAVMARLDKAGI